MKLTDIMKKRFRNDEFGCYRYLYFNEEHRQSLHD